MNMKVSRRDLILLIVMGVIGLAVGGWYTYQWYSKDVSRLRQEKEAKEKDLAMVEEKVRDLAALEQRLVEARKLQADFERLVPKSQELPQLLRDTANILTIAGVDLNNFTPGAAGPSPVPELTQLTVAVSAKGKYDQIIRMFQSLRSWHRLIGISNFSLSSGGTESDPVLACQFNMVVFYANQ